MTPGFMLYLLAASGLVEMQNAAARARGVDDACTVPVGPEKVADSATRKVADQATQKVAESARGPVAEQATFHVADSATPEVAHSATVNRPLPNDSALGGEGGYPAKPKGGFETPLVVSKNPPCSSSDGVTRDSGVMSATCPRDVPDLSQGTAARQRWDTFSLSLRQHLAESLPRSLPATLNHESDTMNSIPSLDPFADARRLAGCAPAAAQVQALAGALDAAGRIHTQAFGSDTIRGLIYELAKCQDALAGFLPKGDPADVAPAVTPSEAHASPLEAPGEQGASESRHPPHAVNTLVATAYRATRDNLAAMQAARDELSMQMAHQRERLLDLQEHFGSEEDAMRALETYLGPLP